MKRFFAPDQVLITSNGLFGWNRKIGFFLQRGARYLWVFTDWEANLLQIIVGWGEYGKRKSVSYGMFLWRVGVSCPKLGLKQCSSQTIVWKSIDLRFIILKTRSDKTRQRPNTLNHPSSSYLSFPSFTDIFLATFLNYFTRWYY